VVPKSDAIAEHASAGDRVLWVAAIFGVCLFGVVVLDVWRRAAASAELAPAERWLAGRAGDRLRRGAPGWTGPAFAVARVALAILAVAVLVTVIQAGHTGAHAVWSDYPSLAP
jgi:hypothetical protein